MSTIQSPNFRLLAIFFWLYLLASLVHFIHNAEFIEHYPGLPESWTRSGVYLAWIGLTTIGVSGWIFLRKGYYTTGLLLVLLYAMLGVDSLSHYVVASVGAHTLGMNLTIILEVTAAGLVFVEVIRLLIKRKSESRTMQGSVQ